MLVAEANQVDITTETAAYADDLTAAGTIMRSIRNIKNQLKQLDDVIRTEFISTIQEG